MAAPDHIRGAIAGTTDRVPGTLLCWSGMDNEKGPGHSVPDPRGVLVLPTPNTLQIRVFQALDCICPYPTR